MNGLKLANVQPVFLSPEYDYVGQFTSNVSFKTVEAAIRQYPNAKVLILTSPNYYGMVSRELGQIIKLAHANGLLVLVDEAHGAHFTLGDPFPPSAVELGADIIVQSAHKTLPAMTMGSFLHCNNIDSGFEKIEYYLQAIQSSSPSYPIMASLDLARYFLAHINETEKGKIINHIRDFHKQLSTIPQLTVVPNESDTSFGDPLKLIVQSKCKLSGYDLQKTFEKQSIYTELADPWNVLFVLPLATNSDWTSIVEKLKETVQHLAVQPISQKSKYLQTIGEAVATTLSIPYQSMGKYKKELVPIEQLEGHIAATSVIPYPPGIPLILEGERVTINHIKQLKSLESKGAYFQNNNDIIKNGLEVFKM